MVDLNRNVISPETNKGKALTDLEDRIATLESDPPVTPGAIGTTQLADGGVTNAKLGAAAVTGTKLSPTGITSGSFAGSNGAGACTLVGATVGQRVFALFEIDTASGTVGEQSKFESTITVNGQIQQSNAGNLSAKKYAVILLPIGA
jgi:hypothetical protein